MSFEKNFLFYFIHIEISFSLFSPCAIIIFSSFVVLSDVLFRKKEDDKIQVYFGFKL